MPKRATRPPSPVVALLIAALDSAFDRKSWHGPNLMTALRGVRAEGAARPAIPGRKSVWDQTLHAAFWKHRALNYLTGESEAFPRKVKNWPRSIPDPSERAWRADVELLRDLNAR